MSLGKIVQIFARKRGFILQDTNNGFEMKGKNREWLLYEQEKGVEMLLYGKSFALSGMDESMVHVISSAKEKELIVHVRYGCLRDYINQLRTSDSPVLVDLRQRFESRLDGNSINSHVSRWAQENFSKFDQAVIYDLLGHFYP